MQKFALAAEISTKVAGGATFCVHPVDIPKMYLHAKMNFICQSFQKLEHCNLQTDITYRQMH